MDHIPINEKYCVLDIETWCSSGKVDPLTDVLRYVGFRTYKGTNLILHYEDREKIQKMLDFYPYIIGHNLKNYDIPVLERHGFTIPKYTVIVDTYEITDNRLKSMLYIDLEKGDRSLDSLLKRFDLPVSKLTFDYSLLKEEYLIGEEYKQLERYLTADLEGADELFKYFYSFFYGFRQYMSEQNQNRMCWLVNRSGSTAYKMICNMANLLEEYDDSVEILDNKYEGGYVSQPYLDYVEG